MSLYGYGFDRRRHCRAVAWQAMLDAAASEEEIVTAARDYVAMLTPEEIAELPRECRPFRIVDGSDVTDYAFRLAHEQFLWDPLESSTLQKLSAFMTSASLRLSQILAASPQAGDLQ